jgi:hypothetical protein
VAVATSTGVSPTPEQPEQQQQLPSIHKIMEEDKLKELNGGKTTVAALGEAVTAGAAAEAAAPAAAATTGLSSKKLGPLVDYDSDSDEESSTSEEDASGGLPPAKRVKPNSASAV